MMPYVWQKFATNSGFPSGGWLMPMGWGGYSNSGPSTACPAIQSLVNSPLFGVVALLYLLTWVLGLLALVALIRFLWKRAGK